MSTTQKQSNSGQTPTNSARKKKEKMMDFFNELYNRIQIPAVVYLYRNLKALP
ncbi:hypothetical protein Hanom_Chr07g00592341 [Helianthus anomalus]